MGVELILNSANINYLAFAFYGGGKYDGQIFAIFVIMLAAAEAVIGLAVVLAIYQNFKTIYVDATETLRGWLRDGSSHSRFPHPSVRVSAPDPLPDPFS